MLLPQNPQFFHHSAGLPRHTTYNRVDNNDYASLGLLEIAAIKRGESEVYSSLERLLRMKTLLTTVAAVQTSKETTLSSNRPQSWTINTKIYRIKSQQS